MTEAEMNAKVRVIKEILYDTRNKSFDEGYNSGVIDVSNENLRLFSKIQKLKEDMVSRQAVDELSKELVHTTRDKADFLCNFWERLQKLPPVTPQPKTRSDSMNAKEKEKFTKHMNKFSREQLVGWMAAISFILPMDEVNTKLGSKLLEMFNICGNVIDEKE